MQTSPCYHILPTMSAVLGSQPPRSAEAPIELSLTQTSGLPPPTESYSPGMRPEEQYFCRRPHSDTNFRFGNHCFKGPVPLAYTEPDPKRA